MARLMKSARGILALVVSFSLALVLGLVPMTSANAAEIAISGMPKESIPAAFGGSFTAKIPRPSKWMVKVR